MMEQKTQNKEIFDVTQDSILFIVNDMNYID
jgi:hypothetical protein